MTDSPGTRWRRLKGLFEELSGIPPAGRSGRLAELGRDDPALAAELAELLEEHDRDRPLRLEEVLAAEAGEPSSLTPGRRVGPYRLVELLGRGGMGQVFLAERVDGQFEQQVALKVMREALDTPDTRARFLAERQILARLEHPDIARLLDGAVTDDGVPYLVMELVRGEPITEHCDRERLPVEDRLRLFVQVCRAVHAAHRQLVVHRDLKPSNILVDGEGRVRLLDFGIAKLLDPALGGDVPLTRTGLYLLTPEYASPEQVTGAPVGTTTDVYALGLLLYRLLTGLHGQPVEDLSPAGIHRAVVEHRPERPSRAALREPAEAAVQRARLRGGLSPGRLARRLEGDLDTIVEMAVRKEPDRRYLSAEDLAADVERHLRRLPVAARRDTFAYHATRFVARHRSAVAAACAGVLALAVGLAAAVHGLVEARRAEARAVAEAAESRRLADFMVELFDASDPVLARGEEPSARSLLERGAARIGAELDARPELKADLLLAIGRAYDQLGEYDAAAELLREAMDLRPAGADPAGRAEVLWALSRLQLRTGEFDAAVESAAAAVEIVEGAAGIDPDTVADAYSCYGQNLFEVRRGEESIGPLRRAVELRRSLGGYDRHQMAIDLDYLGNAVFEIEDQQEGLAILADGVAELERAGLEPGQLANGLSRFGLRQVAAGRYEEAEITLRRSRALAREAAGDGHHPEVQDAELALATLAEARGELDAAADSLVRALAESVAIWGEEHPKSAMMRLRLGRTLLAAGRPAEALDQLERGRDLMAARVSGHHAHLAAFELPLARTYAALGRRDDALAVARPLASSEDSRYAEPATELVRELERGAP